MAIALYCAVCCYLGAAVLAALPLARPYGSPPPVGRVVAILGVGVIAHGVALLLQARATGTFSVAGLGPATSFASFTIACALIVTEVLTHEVALTLVGGPLAAIIAGVAILVRNGALPAMQPHGGQEAWLVAHIALSFAGIAALATAGAAGMLYLVERRELKSRHFGSVFRFFPPLETLDRVNHIGVVVGWVALTAGLVLAATYTAVYGHADPPRVAWGLIAWLAATAVALGRILGGWRARRAAVAATIAFVVLVVSYFAARVVAARPGSFL